MSQNTYLYEKLAAERLQDIRREVAQRQVLSNVPRQRQNIARQVVSRFGAMLVVLGTRMEQVDSRHGHTTRPLDLRA